MSETTNSAALHDAPTLFQKMLRGKIPTRFVLNSARLRVAGIVDIHPAEHTRYMQVVVFPYRPGKREQWDPRTRMLVGAATQAVIERMTTVYVPEVVVEHGEGYDVDHGHMVVLPAFARGESAALHDPIRLQTFAPEAALDAVHEQLRFSARDLNGFEAGVIAAAESITRL